MRRILFVDASASLTEAEGLLMPLLEGLDEYGWQAVVCHRPGGRLAAALERWPGLRTVPCRFGPRTRPERSGRLARSIDLLELPLLALAVAQVALAALTRRVAVVHAVVGAGERPVALVVGGLAAWLTRRPLVAHVQGGCQPSRGVRFVLSRAARILVDSEACKAEHLRCLGPDAERIEVVPPGVAPPEAAGGEDLRETQGLPERAVVLGLVGPLTPESGQADLLAAFRQVLAEHHDVYLLLVGDEADASRYGAALQTLAARLGVDDHVRFVQGACNRGRLLRTLDVLVDARWEGGPGPSLLAALAQGLAVVATRSGGTAEAVDDGHTGLLVPPKDPDALAAALLELVDDDKRRRALGAAARIEARQRHDLEAHVERVAGVLDEITLGV